MFFIDAFKKTFVTDVYWHLEVVDILVFTPKVWNQEIYHRFQTLGCDTIKANETSNLATLF